jgi:hypothetical protein
MMVRKLMATLAVLLIAVGVSSADEWELGLSAGDESIIGGVHYKSYLPGGGYYRIGGSGVYVDDAPKEYKWGSADFTVGNETLYPGLTVDVGLRGIIGSAEKRTVSGDIGAIAFTGGVGYLLPSWTAPIPIELFSRVTYSPAALSFADADQYLEFTIGGGVRIIQNASVILSYTAYRVDMESGPGDWELEDDVLQVGLALRF